MSPEDIELSPEQTFRLVEFLVERGRVKAAADIMIATYQPLVQRAEEHGEVCR